LTYMIQDLRFAFRTLSKSPAFLFAAIASLTLGIGANTAMFSVLDAMILRPLPVVEPSRVFAITPKHPVRSTSQISYRDLADLRDRATSLQSMAIYTPAAFSLRSNPAALPKVQLCLVASANLFEMAGVQPALGRGFLPSEDKQGGDPVAVLSHIFWLSEFNADPSVLGKRIRIGTLEFTVVGIAPESFTGLEPFVRYAAFVPMGMAPLLMPSSKPVLEDRDARSFQARARLRNGVSATQATAELQTIASALAQAYPDTNRDLTFLLRTEMQRRLSESPSDAVLSSMLMALAIAVLLIACTNVANLFLVRGRARTREMAVRLAIGAPRTALVRQMLTESLLVALGGGLLGLLAGYGCVWFIRNSSFVSDNPIHFDVRMDERVLLFTTIVSMMCALLVGSIPALRSLKSDLTSALRASDSGPLERLWGRNLLVVLQVALSVALLMASAMMVQGFRKALLHEPGFDLDRTVAMTIDPTVLNYGKERTLDMHRRLLEGAKQIPGVRSAALAHTVPFGFDQRFWVDFVPQGFEVAANQKAAFSFGNSVTPEYFSAMGIAIVNGRGIAPTDTEKSLRVVVINEELARRYWPNQNPLGKTMRIEQTGEHHEVVGVARQSKYMFATEPPMTHLYLPASQSYSARMSLFVSADRDAAALAGPLRNLMRSVDAAQPVFEVRTLRTYYHQRSIVMPLRLAQLVSAMGLAGLCLAVIGLYGVISYSVSRRTREIGVRMAIGASRGSVVGLVLRQGGALTGMGVALGLALAIPARGVLTARLSGMAEADPASLLGPPAAVLLVAALACYLPARRAATVDPLSTLRHE
jgi:predicted permease